MYFDEKAYDAIQLCVDSGVTIEEPLDTNDPKYEEYLKQRKVRELGAPVAVVSRALPDLVDNPEDLYIYSWRPDPNKEEKEFVKLRPR